MAYRYPIMLDVRDRQIVIVGGGAVAARKARRLLDAGATRIRAIAPDFDQAMPEGIECIHAAYSPEHLDESQLVFAATDASDVNDAVVRDARSRGAWVNRADVDDELAGDFTVPSSLEDGPVIVSVSCGSPSLSRRIREHLAAQLNPQWAAFALALNRLRPLVREDRQLTADQRRDVLMGLSSDRAFEAFARGGTEGMIAAVQAMCPGWTPQPLS